MVLPIFRWLLYFPSTAKQNAERVVRNIKKTKRKTQSHPLRHNDESISSMLRKAHQHTVATLTTLDNLDMLTQVKH